METLPVSFSAKERAAYEWLYDCDVNGWVVDLLTHEVQSTRGKYCDLVAFRKSIEREAKEGGE